MDLIVANWKMNPPTLKGAELLFDSVRKEIRNLKKVEVVICPPFLYLFEFLSRKRENQIKFGAQDCFWEEKGAFTGEISPTMLKNLGCQYVILGHSERREYLQETNEMINKKIKAALKAKLKPILCIGETERQRKTGKTKAVLKSQLKCLEVKHQAKLIVAYEPVWAIGTGKACGISEAKETNLFIRKIVKDAPILYGGSVNSENAKDYIEKAGFQGLLVGGTCLKAKEFGKIVKTINLMPNKII